MPASRPLPRVAFIGVGAMGEPMAVRLLQAGAAVAAHDVVPAAVDRLARLGARAAANPADAARDAAVLVVMVQNAAQVDDVLFAANGAARALPRGAVVWLASTVQAPYVRGLGERLGALGLLLAEGPVSGGVTGAESGALTVLAAGADAALAAAGPVMAACATRVMRVGELGAGATFKMINQVLTASHIALAAEAIAFGRRAGVDESLLVEVVRASSGNSAMFDKRAPRMVAGDHTPHVTLKIFMKDLDIALEAAGALDFPLTLGAAARAVYARAAAGGHENDSDTLLPRAYEGAGAGAGAAT